MLKNARKTKKSERATLSVHIKYISTLNKREKGDLKRSSQPFVQDCTKMKYLERRPYHTRQRARLHKEVHAEL